MMRRKTSRANLVLGPGQIGIDNFQFTPATLTVKAGSNVTFINKDDVPHLIVNTQNRFRQSPVLDTDQQYGVTITRPGTYDYFCSLHPKMQGKIIAG
jgi:plastocyanin